MISSSACVLAAKFRFIRLKRTWFLDGEDFEFEEFVVAVAVGLAFHGFDCIVRPFQRSRRDRLVVSGQDTPAMNRKRSGELLEYPHPGPLGLHDP